MQAKKYYGQNFLHDETIIQKIVDLIPSGDDDLIVEIGPGQGALTKYLCQKSSSLICFEIDRDMQPYLAKYSNESTHVIYADFLSVNLDEYIDTKKYKNIYVVGNLPYYITSPIIEKIIDSGLFPNKMVFMVQDEVAKRFSASCGSKDYGYMTLYIGNYYQCQYEIFVDKTKFIPSPKVNSAVVSMKLYNSGLDRGFTNFLKEAFTHKRKTLKNNLVMYDWHKINNILNENGLLENVRAEQIPIDILFEIYKNIK